MELPLAPLDHDGIWFPFIAGLPVQVRDTVQPNAGTMIQAVSDVNRDWIAEQAESDVRTLCHPSAVPFEPAQSAGIALRRLSPSWLTSFGPTAAR